MFDCHVHTAVSYDSEMPLIDVLQEIEETKHSFCITEHYDFNIPDFNFEVEEFFAAYSKFRSERLLLGIELGLGQEIFAESKALSKDQRFDQIIGSIHVVDGEDIYLPDYYMERGEERAYERYFQTMLDNVIACDFFDVLGHVDYVARYAPTADPEIHLTRWKEYLEPVFKTLIGRGQVLELNSRRLGLKRAQIALKPIYQFYNELGGKYVTIGSDAHIPQALAINAEVAGELAAECGLQPVYFKQRKIELVKIT
ncbi:MAG: PHP domain-containing protein [Clostridia bacterium]